MQIDKDVEVPGRAGPIVVDVFRPDGDEPVPVIACISPYGKADATANLICSAHYMVSLTLDFTVMTPSR